ncbi:hypothetical protein [Sphingobium sp. CFD-1]|uniref:hypothetical protein n=1 Tax=Sphingobium sp. CFD-1 TaxID=2878545 RepID=UPI00214CA810|nr:hypothetical protein [Sphingobium sp. CFD-1]
MTEAPLWFTIGATVWGMLAPPVAYIVGRRNEKRAAVPNVRPDFTAGSGGYSGHLEIQARTSEDIIVSSIDAAGRIHTGDTTMLMDNEGNITGHDYDFQRGPRSVYWRIPGGEVRRFKVVVDSLYDFDIRLTISSSASTLVDRSLIVRALQMP